MTAINAAIALVVVCIGLAIWLEKAYRDKWDTEEKLIDLEYRYADAMAGWNNTVDSWIAADKRREMEEQPQAAEWL